MTIPISADEDVSDDPFLKSLTKSAKEQLLMDGKRALDDSVELPIDPLYGEDSLDWKALEDFFKQLGSVEHSLTCSIDVHASRLRSGVRLANVGA